MKTSILTLFPDLYKPFLESSLIGRASKSRLFTSDVLNLLDLQEPKKRVDSPTVGPGTGMLIKPDIIERAIDMQEKKHGKAFKIFFTPQGKKMTQPLLAEVAQKIQENPHTLLFASRYEGIDSRVEQEYADLELSLGDFVLMGGDIPAMAFLEGVLRFVPGIVGNAESVEKDSFTGPWVDYPEYTHPVDWKGHLIPDIVQSGHHAAIEEWRQDKAAEKTVKKHFDWLRSWNLNAEEKKRAQAHIPPHFMAILHDDMMLKDGRIGSTSVTTMDIHDIARSCRTYDIQNYFITTKLKDQGSIVQTLLDFWKKGAGESYNSHRFQAVSRVELAQNLDQIIEQIEQKTGKKPLVIATSAQPQQILPEISFHDQGLVWDQDRPVLMLLGTGYGLSEQILSQCDYMLTPIEGFSDFNHLSVRTAAGIILDRWLGVNTRYLRLAK